MDQIIDEGQSLEDDVTDGLRVSATKAIEQYISLPIPRDPNDPTKKLDTFSFWKDYEKTVDPAQKCLCKIAKRFLTPPPTSTGHCITNMANIVFLN